MRQVHICNLYHMNLYVQIFTILCNNFSIYCYIINQHTGCLKLLSSLLIFLPGKKLPNIQFKNSVHKDITDTEK